MPQPQDALPAEYAFRAEVTPELVASVEPRIVALLVWWTERWQEDFRSRGRVPLAILRWTGFALSIGAILATGWVIVVMPDRPCRPAPILELNVLMAFLVLCATFFGFYGRLIPVLNARGLRAAARRGGRFVARLRRKLPFSVEYTISDGRLVGRVEKPKVTSATELARVERVAFAGPVACLYGGRFPRLVQRLVWLPDDAARDALREALRRAGAVEVTLP